ncbi:MAG: TAXI family TRAP transporter solute-binding subunit [Endozoicomonadaceae bacterium]|nr:TAXI family TRAP transporter solute-binding subunit [Endozoicomonadaceae bacterium]
MKARSIKKILIGSLICSSLTVSYAEKEGSQAFISIGTGGVTGVYYPAGGSICRVFNKLSKEEKLNIRCSAESTGGSIYNINSIRSGQLDFGVAQSDWQYHAFNGTSKFKDQGKFDDLRAVFSLHPEPFTVVARKDSGIKTFNDLKGKRVNIGNPGSGQRGTMEVVMNTTGMTTDDFKATSELKSAEQSKALCDNKVDAIVFTVGHPNGSIKEATTTCDSVLVEVNGAEIEKLIADNDYYRSTVIPAGMYKGSDQDVSTFGVGATLVVSAKVSETAVYTLVKAVFENFDAFRKLHPAFNHLKKEQMIKDGLSAPLHSGAIKYYKEVGLIK